MAWPLVWVLASIEFALELVLWVTGAWAKDGRANGAGQPILHAPSRSARQNLHLCDAHAVDCRKSFL